MFPERGQMFGERGHVFPERGQMFPENSGLAYPISVRCVLGKPAGHPSRRLLSVTLATREKLISLSNKQRHYALSNVQQDESYYIMCMIRGHLSRLVHSPHRVV
jgi:hypothetical protein